MWRGNESLATHVCKACGYTARTLPILNRHTKICDGKPQDKQSDDTKSPTNQSEKSDHNDIKCDSCEFTCRFPSQLNKHLQSSHKMDADAARARMEQVIVSSTKDKESMSDLSDCGSDVVLKGHQESQEKKMEIGQKMISTLKSDEIKTGKKSKIAEKSKAGESRSCSMIEPEASRAKITKKSKEDVIVAGSNSDSSVTSTNMGTTDSDKVATVIVGTSSQSKADHGDGMDIVRRDKMDVEAKKNIIANLDEKPKETITYSRKSLPSPDVTKKTADADAVGDIADVSLEGKLFDSFGEDAENDSLSDGKDGGSPVKNEDQDISAVSNAKKAMVKEEETADALTYVVMQCRKCDYIAQDEIDIAEHIQSSHRTAATSFTCGACYFNADSRNELTAHYASVHKARPKRRIHSCSECLYTTPSTNNFKRHWGFHTRREQFKCYTCSYSSPAEGTVRRHIAQYHPPPSADFKFDTPTSSNGSGKTKKSKAPARKSAIVKDEASISETNQAESEKEIATSADDDEGSDELIILTYKSKDGGTMLTCSDCDMTYSSYADMARHTLEEHGISLEDCIVVKKPVQRKQTLPGEKIAPKRSVPDDSSPTAMSDTDSKTLSASSGRLLGSKSAASQSQSKKWIKCAHCEYESQRMSDMRRHLARAVENLYPCGYRPGRSRYGSQGAGQGSPKKSKSKKASDQHFSAESAPAKKRKSDAAAGDVMSGASEDDDGEIDTLNMYVGTSPKSENSQSSIEESRGEVSTSGIKAEKPAILPESSIDSRDDDSFLHDSAMFGCDGTYDDTSPGVEMMAASHYKKLLEEFGEYGSDEGEMKERDELEDEVGDQSVGYLMSLMCKFCGFMGTPSEVANHTKIHTGQKLYWCTCCTYKTIRRSDMRKHLLRYHATKTVAPEKISRLLDLCYQPHAPSSTINLETMIEMEGMECPPLGQRKVFCSKRWRYQDIEQKEEENSTDAAIQSVEISDNSDNEVKDGKMKKNEVKQVHQEEDDGDADEEEEEEGNGEEEEELEPEEESNNSSSLTNGKGTVAQEESTGCRSSVLSLAQSRPYKCSMCSKRSNWPSDIRNHIKSVHPKAKIIKINTAEARASCAGLLNKYQDETELLGAPAVNTCMRLDEGEISTEAADNLVENTENKDEKNAPPAKSMTESDVNPSTKKCEKVSPNTKTVNKIVSNAKENKGMLERNDENDDEDDDTMLPKGSFDRKKLKRYKCCGCPYRSNFRNDIPRHWGRRHKQQLASECKIILMSVEEAAATIGSYNYKWMEVDMENGLTPGIESSNMERMAVASTAVEEMKTEMDMKTEKEQSVVSDNQEKENREVEAVAMESTTNVSTKRQHSSHYDNFENAQLKLRQQADDIARCCMICPYVTDKSGHLKLHMSYHQPQARNTYRCRYCPFYVRTARLLNHHILLHLPKGEAAALAVGRPITAAAQSQTPAPPPSAPPSTSDHHRGIKRKYQYVCEQCPYVSYVRGDYWLHRRNHFEKPNMPFRCDCCPYWVDDKRLLVQHTLLHDTKYCPRLLPKQEEETCHEASDNGCETNECRCAFAERCVESGLSQYLRCGFELRCPYCSYHSASVALMRQHYVFHISVIDAASNTPLFSSALDKADNYLSVRCRDGVAKIPVAELSNEENEEGKPAAGECNNAQTMDSVPVSEQGTELDDENTEQEQDNETCALKDLAVIGVCDEFRNYDTIQESGVLKDVLETSNNIGRPLLQDEALLGSACLDAPVEQKENRMSVEENRDGVDKMNLGDILEQAMMFADIFEQQQGVTVTDDGYNNFNYNQPEIIASATQSSAVTDLSVSESIRFDQLTNSDSEMLCNVKRVDQTALPVLIPAFDMDACKGESEREQNADADNETENNREGNKDINFDVDSQRMLLVLGLMPHVV